MTGKIYPTNSESGRTLTQFKHLAHYERLAIEGPTTRINEELGKMADLDGLVFENHVNAFNDQEEEALDRDMTEKLQNLRTRDDTNTQQVSSLHKCG